LADENTEKKETKPEPIKEESKSRTIKDLSTTEITMLNMMIKTGAEAEALACSMRLGVEDIKAYIA
jgi:hypothetical protein